MISVLCDEFKCLPSQIEKEDWMLVKRIMEHRTLEAARAQHNADVTKMSPGMAKLWAEVIVACDG